MAPGSPADAARAGARRLARGAQDQLVVVAGDLEHGRDRRPAAGARHHRVRRGHRPGRRAGLLRRAARARDLEHAVVASPAHHGGRLVGDLAGRDHRRRHRLRSRARAPRRRLLAAELRVRARARPGRVRRRGAALRRHRGRRGARPRHGLVRRATRARGLRSPARLLSRDRSRQPLLLAALRRRRAAARPRRRGSEGAARTTVSRLRSGRRLDRGHRRGRAPTRERDRPLRSRLPRRAARAGSRRPSTSTPRSNGSAIWCATSAAASTSRAAACTPTPPAARRPTRWCASATAPGAETDASRRELRAALERDLARLTWSGGAAAILLAEPAAAPRAARRRSAGAGADRRRGDAAAPRR